MRRPHVPRHFPGGWVALRWVGTPRCNSLHLHGGEPRPAHTSPSREAPSPVPQVQRGVWNRAVLRVRLNTPGAADGVAGLGINGQYRSYDKMVWRKSAGTLITEVRGSAGLGLAQSAGSAITAWLSHAPPPPPLRPCCPPSSAAPGAPPWTPPSTLPTSASPCWSGRGARCGGGGSTSGGGTSCCGGAGCVASRCKGQSMYLIPLVCQCQLRRCGLRRGVARAHCVGGSGSSTAQACTACRPHSHSSLNCGPAIVNCQAARHLQRLTCALAPCLCSQAQPLTLSIPHP